MTRLLLACLALCLCALGSAFTAGAPSRLAGSVLARAPAVMKTGDSTVDVLRKATDEELAAQLDAARAAMYDMRHKRATRQTVKNSDYQQEKYKVSLISQIQGERAK